MKLSVYAALYVVAAAGAGAAAAAWLTVGVWPIAAASFATVPLLAAALYRALEKRHRELTTRANLYRALYQRQGRL